MTKSMLRFWSSVLFIIFLFQIPVWYDNRGMAAEPPISPDIQKPADSVLPMTDIHDIRGPEQWNVNPLLLKYGLIGIITLIIIVTALWRLHHGRRKKADIETIVPEVSPEDTAFNLLDEIADLMASDAREYYYRLSEILRGYIEKRFEIDALGMTSEELLPGFTALDIDPGLKKDIKVLISFADPVKFAKQPVALSQMTSHHELVRRFVQKTTPEVPTFDTDVSGNDVPKHKPEMIPGH